MKIRFTHVWWMLGIGAFVACAIAVCVLLQPAPDGPAMVNETRAKLRAQGYKTDLADFNFSTPPDVRAREAMLTGTMPVASYGFGQWPDLMEFDNDSGLVVWKMNSLKLSVQGGTAASWDEIRSFLAPNDYNLDAACDAILAGPIAFNLDDSNGYVLLPHLAMLSNLTMALGWRSMIALHDGDNNSAWTNTLAATRLVTAWQMEPVEMSHRARFRDETLVFDITWQMLQAHRWQDNELKQLQDEWESLNLLTNLSETVAFNRATSLAAFQHEQRAMLRMGVPASALAREALHNQSSFWANLRARWYRNEYLHGPIYQDEADMLNFYCGLEQTLHKAEQAANWREMSAFPGMTNELVYIPKPSAARSGMWGMTGILRPRRGSRLGESAGFIGNAAEAETQRRILITAIALERYYEKHGAYPHTLKDLQPEFLNNVPADFMDGQPLRYRRTDDGHFVLYSVGLKGTDDGGRMSYRELYTGFNNGYYGVDPDGNIVWPPPASDAAAQVAEASERDAQFQKEDDNEEGLAANQWNHTAEHQLAAEMMLAALPQKTSEVSLDGTPLSVLLCNTNTAGTNRLSLSEMLALKQVITGQEPEIVTFKVPIRYDVLKALGGLALLVDTNNDDSDGGCAAQHADVSEANDGDCLLAWNTIYETPGLHALSLDLSIYQPPLLNHEMCGPLLPYTVTNLCQFSLASAQFDPATGVIIHAKLAEMNCKYAVELTATDGAIIKRFTGSTSDGIIKFRWDLMGDNGTRFTNDEFNSVYRITLTDSGRSQTLRGP